MFCAAARWFAERCVSSDKQWLTTTTTAFKKPPFRIHEEGWGEFDMTIDLVADKTHTIKHDLNFSQERYEAKHQIVSSSLCD